MKSLMTIVSLLTYSIGSFAAVTTIECTTIGGKNLKLISEDGYQLKALVDQVAVTPYYKVQLDKRANELGNNHYTIGGTNFTYSFQGQNRDAVVYQYSNNQYVKLVCTTTDNHKYDSM